MKENGIRDKVIMSITGHTDLRSMKVYEGIGDTAAKEAIGKVFGS